MANEAKASKSAFRHHPISCEHPGSIKWASPVGDGRFVPIVCVLSGWSDWQDDCVAGPPTNRNSPEKAISGTNT